MKSFLFRTFLFSFVLGVHSYDFVALTSTNCLAEGMQPIMTATTCTKAAVALGWEDTSPTNTLAFKGFNVPILGETDIQGCGTDTDPQHWSNFCGFDSRTNGYSDYDIIKTFSYWGSPFIVNTGKRDDIPTGCYFKKNTQPIGFWDHKLFVGAGINVRDCSVDQECACWTGPECFHKQGLLFNPTECMCGTTICDPNHTCNADENLCLGASRCPNQQGTQANLGTCICGTNDITTCDSSTGLFCTGETTSIEHKFKNLQDLSSSCSKIPACASDTRALVNGTTIQTSECACGSSVCDSSTGLFCTSSANQCSHYPRCENTAIRSSSFGSTSGTVREKLETNQRYIEEHQGCTCGTDGNDCDGQSGSYCENPTYAQSSCSALPSCVKRRGGTLNSQDCTCGADVCESHNNGRYCNDRQRDDVWRIGKWRHGSPDQIDSLNNAFGSCSHNPSGQSSVYISGLTGHIDVDETTGDNSLNNALNWNGLYSYVVDLFSTPMYLRLYNSGTWNPEYGRIEEMWLYWDPDWRMWMFGGGDEWGPDLQGVVQLQVPNAAQFTAIEIPPTGQTISVMKKTSNGNFRGWSQQNNVKLTSFDDCQIFGFQPDDWTFRELKYGYNNYQDLGSDQFVPECTLNTTTGQCGQSSTIDLGWCRYATCRNYDGLTVNAGDCECGHNACNRLTGLFCTRSTNTCNQYATCPNTDGSFVNSEKCTCQKSSYKFFANSETITIGRATTAPPLHAGSADNIYGYINNYVDNKYGYMSTLNMALFYRLKNNHIPIPNPNGDRIFYPWNDGENICDSSTGLFCTGETNTCSHSAACKIR